MGPEDQVMNDENGMMVEFFQVDAFTSDRFGGNPAAVCLPEGTLPDSVYQDIAAEMNLSETAFIYPVERKEDDIPRFGLRWFTPVKEVDLCGHATLATAKVLLQEIGVNSEVLAFQTRSGPLFAHREGTAIRIDLPASLPEATTVPQGLSRALGDVEIVEAAITGKGMGMLLLEVGGEDVVRSLDPDHRAMMGVTMERPVECVIVTSEASGDGGGPDFVSRVFCPWCGVDEDPVTGAAHTMLAPYWMERLGRMRMEARQLSRRGGGMTVRVDEDVKRVHLTGEAVVVMDGTIRLA